MYSSTGYSSSGRHMLRCTPSGLLETGLFCSVPQNVRDKAPALTTSLPCKSNLIPEKVIRVYTVAVSLHGCCTSTCTPSTRTIMIVLVHFFFGPKHFQPHLFSF